MDMETSTDVIFETVNSNIEIEDSMETSTDVIFETINADIEIEPTPVVTITRSVGSESKKGGPRGPTAKVAPRLEIARAALFEAISTGPTTAKALLEATASQGVLYTDILLVARQAMAAGEIIETKLGRKNSWGLPTEG
jgi:hypothetical protein